MLVLLTRQRDMLKIEGFFNTFRERVACDYMSILGLQQSLNNGVGLRLAVSRFVTNAE
jgi:hypothetical protein